MGIEYYVCKAINCTYSKETSRLCKRVLRAEHFFNINKIERGGNQKPTKTLRNLRKKYEPKPNRRKPSKRRRSRKQKVIKKKEKEKRKGIRVYEHSVYQRGTCGSSP